MIVTQEDFVRKEGDTSCLGEMLDFPDDCFLCGKKLQIPFVVWNGAGEDGSLIALHPRCAQHLSGGLTRDTIELTRGKEIADDWWFKQAKPEIYGES